MMLRLRCAVNRNFICYCVVFGVIVVSGLIFQLFVRNCGNKFKQD